MACCNGVLKCMNTRCGGFLVFISSLQVFNSNLLSLGSQHLTIFAAIPP